MRALGSLAWLFLLLGTLAACGRAQAQGAPLPQSIVREALSVDVPTAFAPADFTTDDFTVEQLDGDAELTLRLVPGSLRWVRVAHLVVVPRALLEVSSPRPLPGAVAYAGFTQPLVRSAHAARAEVPVVLLAGAAYPIRVTLEDGAGATRIATYALRFAPRPAQRGRVMFDSSCSPFGLRAARGAIADDAFLHVGCRLLRTARTDDTAATLELYALYEQAGAAVAIDGIETAPSVDALYTLRVTAAPGRVRLAARGHTLELAYGLPDPLHAAFVGAGIGPYYYRYQDTDVDLETAIPLLTLYAGYAFTPGLRIVYFNAAALHRWGSIDQGLYVWFEQVRFLDERVSLNLLLGANVLIYSHDHAVTGRLSVPQGFEFIVRDLFMQNRSLTAGAFLYPNISGRSYYNVWLRWGSPALFGELNYIEWQEPHGDERTKSRAFGVSFGTPILRLF